MNAGDPQFDELDARMRRLLDGLDAGAGFEAQVMQRVAALAARSRAVRADLREQFERRRERASRRLRRETWSYAASIAGIGLAAGALVWRYSAAIAQWAATLQTPGPVDSMLVSGITLAAIATGLWPLLRRARDPLK